MIEKKLRQKDEDANALEEYKKALEQQELQRKMEIEQREKRTQELMNKMATNVLKNIDQKTKKEELMLMKFTKQKEDKEIQKEQLQKMRHKDD